MLLSIGSDYEEIISQDIIFDGTVSRTEMVFDIQLTPDDLVEDSEMFTVALNSSDSAVVLFQDNATITIQDATSK